MDIGAGSHFLYFTRGPGLGEAQPFHLEVDSGFDFDSNVSQQPNNSVAAQEVQGRGDMVYYQRAMAQYTLFQTHPFNLDLKYDYFENFHPRLSMYDTVMHVVTATPTYGHGSYKFYMPFYFTYADVQSDKYFTAFNLNPTFFKRFSQTIGLELGMKLVRQYAWAPTSLSSFQSSGRGIGGLATLYYFLPKKGGYLMARASYDSFSAEGPDYDNFGCHLILGGLYPVTSGLSVQLLCDMGLQPYEHHYFDGVDFQAKRRNRNLNFGLVVTQKIYKGLSVNAHFYLYAADDTVPLYAYNREVVGMQLVYNY